jgi:hypothetical protein
MMKDRAVEAPFFMFDDDLAYEDDDCGCCLCCCNCHSDYEDDTDYVAPPPEPYQLWLFVELEPKDIGEILKRYYVPAINKQLEEASLLWSLLSSNRPVEITGRPFQIPLKYSDERYRNQDSS